MSQEVFKTTRTWIETDKKHRSYTSVVCGSCGELENLPIKTSAPVPPQVTVKWMQQRGWVMGQKRKDDLCPKCVAAKSRNNVMKLSDHRPAAEAPKPVELLGPKREDRRLIILAIEDHYLDATRGYEDGWSDDTLAKHLNVPRKWIGDLREEFFGPEVDPELAKLAAEFKQIGEQIAAMQTALSDLRAKHNDLKERLSKKGLLQ